MRIITSRCKLTRLIAGALTALFAMGMAGSASAGGIALGGTRVIYPQGDKQASLAIINSSTNTTFFNSELGVQRRRGKISGFCHYAAAVRYPS